MVYPSSGRDCHRPQDRVSQSQVSHCERRTEAAIIRSQEITGRGGRMTEVHGASWLVPLIPNGSRAFLASV